MIADWELNTAEDEDDNDHSLIGKVIDKTKDGTKKCQEGIGDLGRSLCQKRHGGSLNCAVSGNNTGANRIFANLIQKSGRLGIDTDDLQELSTSFRALQNASDPEAALADFNEKIKNVKAYDVDTGIGRSLKFVGLALATTNLVQGLTEHDGVDPEAMIYSAADAVGVGRAGLAVLRSNATWKTTMESGLKNAGKGLGAITLGISVGQTINSLENKDWTGAIVGGMGVVGGALSLMGLTGPGFAALTRCDGYILSLSRIEASNILETEHTEAFLQELDFQREVTHHLRNADSGGRSIGLALQGVMEMSGANPQVFASALARLTPAQALDLAEACHGVDPNGEGVLPQTDDGAAYAGMTQQQEMSDHGLNTSGTKWVSTFQRYKDPRSLEGIAEWILQQGIPLPVGSAT